VFDLLELDGEDLTGRPPLERRARLERAIRPRDGLQLSDAFRGDSQRRFAEACSSGWEGLIAKRAAAPYAHGRSRDWLTLKCAWEQELVIGGYTDPRGSRIEFGALPVGYYENDRLRYAGKVGTGYTVATLRELGARVRALEGARVAVRRRPAGPVRDTLDAAGARRTDRVRRMDERRSAASAALPRVARRQTSGRRRSGATGILTRRPIAQRLWLTTSTLWPSGSSTKAP
jgi:ATP-dependent DNA ligase